MSPKGVLNGQVQPRQIFRSLALFSCQSSDFVLKVANVSFGGTPGDGQPDKAQEKPTGPESPGTGPESGTRDMGRNEIQHLLRGYPPG